MLDPPLHEFLPQREAEIAEVAAQEQEVSIEQMKQRISELEETNPIEMMGHRGCRLAITYPKLYLMQAEAIIRSAAKLNQAGIKVKPEIMIPLVGTKQELETLTNQMKTHISELFIELERLNLIMKLGR